MDFRSWYRIGPQPGFPGGECPSFFPLPSITPGSGPAPAGAGLPTHVHKASHGGDWMQVGTYVAGPPKSSGNWSQTPGVPLTEVKIGESSLAPAPRCMHVQHPRPTARSHCSLSTSGGHGLFSSARAPADMGHFYASKDFYDPVKKRRINWGWAQVPPASTQTLPRVITWNPELQQLVYSPAEEQDSLRGAQLAKLATTSLAANQTLSLGKWAASVGNQSDIEVR